MITAEVCRKRDIIKGSIKNLTDRCNACIERAGIMACDSLCKDTVNGNIRLLEERITALRESCAG